MQLRSAVFVIAAFTCYGLTFLSPKGASINFALILLGILLAIVGFALLISDGIKAKMEERIEEIREQIEGGTE